MTSPVLPGKSSLLNFGSPVLLGVQHTRILTAVCYAPSLQEKWLPQLIKIVDKVNRTFRRAFAKISCAGEVELHQDEQDYDRYAINIKCVQIYHGPSVAEQI